MRRTRTNPVFFVDQLRAEVGDDEFARRVISDPDGLELVTWNVFASLETHADRDWLAHRLQALGGTQVRAPARIALWAGRDREPLLTPNTAWLADARRRAQAAGGDDGALAQLARPVVVPVRIDSPDVVALVETTMHAVPMGTAGRDRLVELADAGLDLARRLGKQLAVAVVYLSGTQVAADLSAHVAELREPGRLAAELPHRTVVGEVVWREQSWQQLLGMWAAELDYLDVDGQPVRAFINYLRERGLHTG